MGITDSKLQELLGELEFIPGEELEKATEAAASSDVSLYDWLTEHDILSDNQLGQLVANEYDLPFVDLSQQGIEEDVLNITPLDIADKYKTVTFSIDDVGLHIATSQPEATDLFSLLATKAGTQHYKLYYATEQNVNQALVLYRKDISSVFGDTSAENNQQLASMSIPDMVMTTLDYAFADKASDVHIEPTRKTTILRFRIDGVLHDVARLPANLHDQLVSRIKVMSKLRTDEHLSAQDGRMSVTIQSASQNIDVRVSIVPVRFGEKVVMRLLASHNRQFGLSDLGMNQAELEKVQNGFRRPYGMVLSTGPTGSGKTTSMYAILKILNTRDINIATIEDPVEYEVEGLNQIQVNSKTNLTFANGLRSILRQDPDTIYVGEIRDEETAGIAINSAMTGHLVLSTLHTNDAATTLPRLIDMKVEPFLVASTVNVVIAQRLVRKICNSCRVSVEVEKTDDGWGGEEKLATQLSAVPEDILKKHFDLGSNQIRLYHGKGCTVCHGSGYAGRVGIFEVMEISPSIHNLITEKASADKINQQAVSEGMVSMMSDGISKVQQGITTIEEVLRVAHE